MTEQEYTCPLCGGFTGPEGSVRAHIRGKSDDVHKGRTGFGVDLETGQTDPKRLHETATEAGKRRQETRDVAGSEPEPEPEPDGGKLTVPDVEPTGEADEPDTSGPLDCPSCGSSLGISEDVLVRMANDAREQHGLAPDAAVEVGACDRCGEGISHAPDEHQQ